MASLEICCFNFKSAVAAAKGGANRIELCKDKELDGTTPSVETFLAVKEAVEIPIYVMIRPRGGSFAYTSFEMLQMEHSIKTFNHAGADGYVFGCLWDREVNETDCEQLIKAADGKPCTFHKAFDMIDPAVMWAQLQLILELGFKAVLTSGQKPTALEGKDMLHKLVWRCEERKQEKPPRPSLDIIAAGGVRIGNLEEIVDTAQGFWYHSSAIVDEVDMVSQNEVEKMRKLLDSYSVEGEEDSDDSQ